MQQPLVEKKCVACEGFETPLNKIEAGALMSQLKEWSLSSDVKKLSKAFTFKDFTGAMRFANAVASIANDEGHHPDLAISWGKVTVETWTHAIGGLSENDFILAAKIDAIPVI